MFNMKSQVISELFCCLCAVTLCYTVFMYCTMSLLGLHFVCFKKWKIVKHFQEIHFITLFFSLKVINQTLLSA